MFYIADRIFTDRLYLRPGLTGTVYLLILLNILKKIRSDEDLRYCLWIIEQAILKLII